MNLPLTQTDVLHTFLEKKIMLNIRLTILRVAILFIKFIMNIKFVLNCGACYIQRIPSINLIIKMFGDDCVRLFFA